MARRLALWAGLAVAIVVGICGCAKSTTVVRLSFDGLTNGSGLAARAIISVRNTGARPVLIEGYRVEVKRQNRREWKEESPMMPVGPMKIEPGQSQKLLVPYPVYDDSWRVRVSYRAAPSGLEAARSRVAALAGRAGFLGAAQFIAPAPKPSPQQVTRELQLKDVLFPEMRRSGKARLARIVFISCDDRG